jgi:hypothetical protein
MSCQHGRTYARDLFLSAILLLLVVTPSCNQSDTGPVGAIQPTPPRSAKTVQLPVLLEINQKDYAYYLKIIGATWVRRETGIDARPEPLVGSYEVGTVSFSSVLFPGRILSTKPLYEDFVRQYGGQYDIHLLKCNVSFFPAKTGSENFESLLKSIEVEIAFPQFEGVSPTVIDVFPKVSFEERGWMVEGQVGVGIGGFIPLEATGVGVRPRADIGVSFQYKPLVAKIISEGSGNRAKWRLQEVKGVRPIGDVTYYCTLLVPKGMKACQAELMIRLWFNNERQPHVEIPRQPVLVDFGV